ncbi:MAG: hypothetical protein FJX74_00775 [Armatimonadetes bacterium]|nr:hypothetical protein [Armatimonadota bacterium]
MRYLLALSGTLALVGILSSPAPIVAQNLDELDVRNEDLGTQLRHPNAYRNELGGRRSSQTRPGGTGYTYRFYDYAKPSFQHFQEGQTYKWSWDLFPGGERRIYSNRPPAWYYGPTHNTYNYYPRYYYGPVYGPWGW